MPFQEPTELQILQSRVSSAEVLLTLVCQQLTDDQKDKIESVLKQKLDVWKGKEQMEDIFDGALHLLKKSV